jgi:non-specific serine/threonine protein kinase
LAQNQVPERGDYSAAKALFEESLAIRRELNDRPNIALSLMYLGILLRTRGDYAAAQPLFEESLAISRELGNRIRIVDSLANLREIAYAQGDYRAAKVLDRESLVTLRESGLQSALPWGIALMLQAIARLAMAEGHPAHAARLWGAAEALREPLGAPLLPREQEEHDDGVAALREALGEAAFAAAWAEGRSMSMEQALAYALEEGVTP